MSSNKKDRGELHIQNSLWASLLLFEHYTFLGDVFGCLVCSREWETELTFTLVMRWACIIACCLPTGICLSTGICQQRAPQFSLHVPKCSSMSLLISLSMFFFFLETLNTTNYLHWLNIILRNNASTLCAGVTEEYCINQFCLLEGVAPFCGNWASNLADLT